MKRVEMTERIQIRIGSDLHKRLTDKSDKTGIPKSVLIRWFIEDGLTYGSPKPHPATRKQRKGDK